MIKQMTSIDLSDLIESAEDPEISRYMFDSFPYPFQEIDAAGYISLSRDCNPPTVMGIYQEEKCVGCVMVTIDTDMLRKNAELGFWLNRKYWRQGLMKQAIVEMIQHVFQNFPDIVRIYGNCIDENRNSIEVMRAAGMKMEYRIADNIVKGHRIYSQVVYGIRRN
jgi:ribosomal-protein-alanine N-acetyltransferase